MAQENPSWGEERIANELLLKLSIRVSPRTVRRSPRRPPGRPRGDLRWSTFLKSHATAIVACDFSKDLLYSFDETRRLADAQVGKLGDAVLYVKLGEAWSAFNAASTHQRAASSAGSLRDAVNDPGRSNPASVGAVVIFSGDPPKNLGD